MTKKAPSLDLLPTVTRTSAKSEAAALVEVLRLCEHIRWLQGPGV